MTDYRHTSLIPEIIKSWRPGFTPAYLLDRDIQRARWSEAMRLGGPAGFEQPYYLNARLTPRIERIG